uniref:Putative secreted peptide n=1 Tax=Anopheles braziliensis TaxID=58242 RepID=A0A2M3ZQY1_9DIPT
MMLRFLLLFHATRHLWYRPVDGRVLGQIRQILRQIDRHRFRRIEGPRPERQLRHDDGDGDGTVLEKRLGRGGFV